MDSPELSDRSKREGVHYEVLRWSFSIIFSIIALLSISFLVGFVAFLIGNLSISTPISVPSQCKIVSSSVDLRSSKVCELGLLNHKAKHVFYPFEKKRFRCHYDYYWASVFQVEYMDHSLGQTRYALAEAPNEALPLDCRPNFGVAWLTKDKFKVNETYNCWYTSGDSQVDIYEKSFFHCQAKDPSTVEMIKRYSTLSTEMARAWFSSGKYWKDWEMIVGLVTGFSTSLISISLVRLLQHLKSWFIRICRVRMISSLRACFLVLYLSFMGWLAIQYGKRLGLPEIFTVD